MRMPRLTAFMPAALIIVSATAAWAAVVSATAVGHSRVSACQFAKDEAVRVIGVNYSATIDGWRRAPEVSRFSQCECDDRGEDHNSGFRWECNVDAHFQPLN
jgi:hypothetical protein